MPKADGPVLRSSHYLTLRAEGPELMATVRSFQAFVHLLRQELGPHAVASPQEWTRVMRTSEPGGPEMFSVDATVMAQIAIQPYSIVRREGISDDRLAGLRPKDVRGWANDVLESLTAGIFESLRTSGLSADTSLALTSVTDAPSTLIKRTDPERIWSRRLRLTPEHSRDETLEARWSEDPAEQERATAPVQRQQPPAQPARRRIGFRPPEDSKGSAAASAIPGPRGERSSSPAHSAGDSSGATTPHVRTLAGARGAGHDGARRALSA